MAGVPVVQAACGVRHSIALTRTSVFSRDPSRHPSTLTIDTTGDGKVFAWGCAADGRLGTQGDFDCHPTPTLLDSLAFARIVQVACGARHCLALSDRGEVVAWCVVVDSLSIDAKG
jgi:alpha-tubulin suppressor-like RCC1 family protein